MKETTTAKPAAETLEQTSSKLSHIMMEHIDEEQRTEAVAQVIAATTSVVNAHYTLELQKATQYAAPKNWRNWKTYRDLGFELGFNLLGTGLVLGGAYLALRPKNNAGTQGANATDSENMDLFSQTSPHATERPSAGPRAI